MNGTFWTILYILPQSEGRYHLLRTQIEFLVPSIKESMGKLSPCSSDWPAMENLGQNLWAALSEGKINTKLHVFAHELELTCLGLLDIFSFRV